MDLLDWQKSAALERNGATLSSRSNHQITRRRARRGTSRAEGRWCGGEERIDPLVMLSSLPLTFMLGPLGLALFLVIRLMAGRVRAVE